MPPSCCRLGLYFTHFFCALVPLVRSWSGQRRRAIAGCTGAGASPPTAVLVLRRCLDDDDVAGAPKASSTAPSLPKTASMNSVTSSLPKTASMNSVTSSLTASSLRPGVMIVGDSAGSVHVWRIGAANHVCAFSAPRAHCRPAGCSHAQDGASDAVVSIVRLDTCYRCAAVGPVAVVSYPDTVTARLPLRVRLTQLRLLVPDGA